VESRVNGGGQGAEGQTQQRISVAVRRAAIWDKRWTVALGVKQ